MRRLLAIGVAAMLILSACASTGDPDAASDAPDDSAEDVPASGPAILLKADTPEASTSGSEALPPDPLPELGSDPDTPDPAEPRDTPPPAEDTEPGALDSEPGAPNDDMPSIVRTVVEDLAVSLGISAETVSLVSHQNVTWPDSSLGCPQKGMGYMQVLTPGTLTILEANGIQYRYHAGSSGSPFLCMTPTDPAPPGTGTDM